MERTLILVKVTENPVTLTSAVAVDVVGHTVLLDRELALDHGNPSRAVSVDRCLAYDEFLLHHVNTNVANAMDVIANMETFLSFRGRPAFPLEAS